ncbi:hypothetical protein [Neolewinella antarctica]|uniref:Uncharacterized protein n=1 Tax=Neolewinella antarctica TaxID=442734 RepID=A0ABX0XDT3_9BACT|nr:hypothetical protein [Neolewinella antarctica]NJC26912.1 hypothetical protein [Neolewinella antarctica]
MKLLFLLFLLVFFCAACDDDDDLNLLTDDIPECVQSAIRGSQDPAVTQVHEVRVADERYYEFGTDACCDFGGFTLNSVCDTVCTTVGFTGMRSGTDCISGNDFNFTRRLVWER